LLAAVADRLRPQMRVTMKPGAIPRRAADEPNGLFGQSAHELSPFLFPQCLEHAGVPYKVITLHGYFVLPLGV